MISEKQILIISNSGDLHVDVIAERIQQLHEKPFRINLDEFPRDYQLSLKFSPTVVECTQSKWQGTIIHIPTGCRLFIENIGAVWLRKTANFSFLSERLSAQEKAFSINETQHTLFSLLFSLDCFWVSHPQAVRSALWKGEQIQRAARLGFNVPPTLITNSVEAATEFKALAQKSIIFKAMSSSFLAAEQVDDNERDNSGLPTTLISEEDIAMLEAVKELPCCFQHYVEKSYELRITIIGEQIFAAKIFTPKGKMSQVDIRDSTVDVRYESYELPLNIKEKCFAFIKESYLNFGAIDVVVTPEQEYVFLENNPVGQFLYIEELIPTLKMRDAMANLLIANVTESNNESRLKPLTYEEAII